MWSNKHDDDGEDDDDGDCGGDDLGNVEDTSNNNVNEMKCLWYNHNFIFISNRLYSPQIIKGTKTYMLKLYKDINKHTNHKTTEITYTFDKKTKHKMVDGVYL